VRFYAKVFGKEHAALVAKAAGVAAHAEPRKAEGRQGDEGPLRGLAEDNRRYWPRVRR
jgi:hypothetical protein